MLNFKKLADKILGRKIPQLEFASSKLIRQKEPGVGHMEYYDAQGNEVSRSDNIRFVSKEVAQWAASLR